ncbi:hypothetical protein HRbin30_01890 [bacterium HR30]|nr:hypothetical protein HRbin30_01890 [bacterium HR30]
MAEGVTRSRAIEGRFRPVARVPLDATVLQAARTMYECGTEAVAVTNEEGRVVGIFTAHDVIGVVGLGFGPEATTVAQWLCSPRECNNHVPRGEAWFG